MAKFRYVVGNGLGDDREDIIAFPDRKLAGLTDEQVNKLVEEDFKVWLKHNATMGWQKVESR